MSEETQSLAAQFGLDYSDSAVPDAAATAQLTSRFCAENRLLPLREDGEIVPVAISDPHALPRVEEAGIILACPVRPVLVPENTLVQAIRTASESAAHAPQSPQPASEDESLADKANEAPVVRIVNLLLLEAINDGASDIHLEPQESELAVRYRIDGILHEGPKPPSQYRDAVISRIKIMARLDIAERRLPQDGRIPLKLLDREYDIRVSTLPGLHGESVVMRILDRSKVLVDLDRLEMQPAMRATFEKLLGLQNGIVLVTGPTGSGKTTTLYACLNRLNRSGVKIMTVEDPVEYRIRGLVQIQTNSAIGLSFAAALRSILRQDPDIVMVGEMRDQETASIAVQAALTGHLVFSTLHTNDAPSAVTRLVDMGVPPYLIASVVRGVLAQRLARRICADCKESYPPERRELLQLFSREPEAPVSTLHRGRGCEECRNTGYRGRLGVYELLVPDDAVRRLVLRSAPAGELAAAASEMTTLREDGVARVLAGQTTVEELNRTVQGELG